MSNCSEHKKDLFGQTDMKVVAEAIGDLRYDTMADLFNHLRKKLWNDYINDEEAGRTELATCLLWTHYAIAKASTGAERAWLISKPFMESNKTIKT